MTTDNPIAKHLKEYHRGELRVVPSRELEAAFQIRGPDLRRTINCLRGDGIPICSSDSGYYYAGTERSGSSGAGSRRSPTRSAASPKRWSNSPTTARCPSPWREVIPLEKLHPLGGRQKQAALADPQAVPLTLFPVYRCVRRQRDSNTEPPDPAGMHRGL